MFYIIGLGNPGEEYRNSRHNTGRMAVLKLAKDLDLSPFEFQKKANALISEGKIGKQKTTLVLPETFMNKSGISAGYFVKSKKAASNLIVIYDDIDLSIGTIKISWNKSSGGHNGLESIIKAVKTKEFLRIRIGVASATPSGKIRKPSGEKAVIDFILGKFKPSEELSLKKSLKTASLAVQSIIEDGKDRAMNQFN